MPGLTSERGSAGRLWLLPMAALFLFSAAVSVNFALLAAAPMPDLQGLTRHVAAVSNARMLYVISTTAFSVALVGSIVYSGAVVLSVRFSASEWLAVLAGAAAWLLVAWRLEFGRVLGGEYGAALLAVIVERVPDGQRPIQVLHMLSALASVAIVCLGAAVCALVHPSRARSTQSMAIGTRHFHQLLYLTTGLYLTGMLMIFSVNYWAALLADEPQRAASLALGNGILLVIGLFYSVMMVTFFVPAALIQMRLIDALERSALQGEPGLNLEHWRAACGLQFAPLTTVKTYVAMASPLLGGAMHFLAKPLMLA